MTASASPGDGPLAGIIAGILRSFWPESGGQSVFQQALATQAACAAAIAQATTAHAGEGGAVVRWLAVQEQANETRRKHPDWRRGQALFNALYDMDPDLANQIRGTAADPFNDDSREPQFAAAILAAHAEPVALCSQCGEMPSVMVKVGTTDGWCEDCLDATAYPPEDRRKVLLWAADEMEAVISDGDVAEVAAPVEGEVGRSACIARRDDLYEEPVEWLRALAAHAEVGPVGTTVSEVTGRG